MLLIYVITLLALLLQGCWPAAVTALAHGTALQVFPFQRQQWNVKGDVLVLDAGSMTPGDSPLASPYMSDDQCNNACARTPGCNAWVYCNSEQGCGSGCKDHTKQNPSLTLAKNADPSTPNPAWYKLTKITGLGLWGSTSKCMDDKWAYGTCTLLKSPTPDAPTFWSKDPSEGWVSGTSPFPKECQGLTLRTCSRCSYSKDPAKCRACANRPELKFGLLRGLYAYSEALADGCAACVNSTLPDMCMACMACMAADKPGTCGDCALGGESPYFDATACLECTHKHGAEFLSPCLQCAVNGDKEGQVGECMNCLDTMKPLACNSADRPMALELGCWDQTNPSANGACSTCVRHPDTTHSGFCTACIQTSPYTDTCQMCASMEDECKQARCFQCIDASGHHPGSGCFDCLQFLSEPAKQQRCLACMASPQLSVKAKESCLSCQERCSSPDDAAKCMKCLQTEQEDYKTACSC